MNGAAYMDSSSSLSVEELYLLERKLCAFLLEGGYKTAAVFGKTSSAVFAAIRACLLTGVCYIPVDAETPAKRLGEMLSCADAVLYDGEKPPCGIPCADIRCCAEGYEPLGTLPTVPDCRAAYIIFTSGTTGVPKGIRVSRKNLRCFADWLLSLPAIREEKPRSVLNQARFSFDLSVAGICCSLFGGMDFAAPEQPLLTDFPKLFAFMENSGAEMAVLTPSFAEMCLCDSSFCGELLPRLRVLFFCGETLKPSTARKLILRFPKARIINAYGPTEATCAVCACEITADMTAAALPVGEIGSAASEIHILTPDNREAKEGEIGEILICGDSAAEYINAEGGFSVIDGSRCFHTGDLGYTAEGRLYFCGRRDRQVKLLGHRIELSDIENSLCEISGVRRAAAAVETKGGFPVITAVIEAEKGVSEALIKQEMKKLLPSYMLPRKILLTDSIPINANGKTTTGALL